MIDYTDIIYLDPNMYTYTLFLVSVPPIFNMDNLEIYTVSLC